MNKKSDFFLHLFILAAIVTSASWMFDGQHWFVYDDITHLYVAKFSDLIHDFSVWPRFAYNDRPMGIVFYRTMQTFFDLNVSSYHTVRLLIHLLNSYLVYKLAGLIFRSKPDATNIALISFLIFGLWPKSTFAVQWSAAIFDLLGATFLLLTLYTALSVFKTGSKKLHPFLLFGSVAFFYFGLRTKEMLATLPAILLLLSLHTVFSDNMYQTFKLFRASPRYLIHSTWILFSISLAYIFTILRFISKGESVVTDSNSPYKIGLSISSVMESLWKYLSIYFNIFQMDFSPAKLSPVSLLVVLLLSIVLIFRFVKQRNKTVILLFLCFVIAIAPVLVMRNMQHILYLYIPSIFLSMILADFLSSFKTLVLNKMVSLPLITLALVGWNFSSPIVKFRDYWIATSAKDKKSYEDLLKISKQATTDTDIIAVLNANDNYNIFTPYGPGNINKIIFNKKDIKTLLLHSLPENIDPNTLYLKYDPSTGGIQRID